MKKLMSLGVACLMAITALPVSAMTISLDGVKKEVSSKVVEDRTMIPLREFSNLMGYEIDYKGPQHIKVINPMTSESITLSIDLAEFKDTTGNAFKAEASPKLIDGNTYVPLRVVAENLGVKVNVDGKGSIVLKTEYNVNLGSALENNGNAISEALKADYEKNKESVKVAQQVYSKYADMSVLQLKGKDKDIIKDIDSLSSLKTTPNSLSQVFISSVIDCLRNEYNISNSLNSGIDTSMLEIYRTTHKNNLDERVQYIKNMK